MKKGFLISIAIIFTAGCASQGERKIAQDAPVETKCFSTEGKDFQIGEILVPKTTMLLGAPNNWYCTQNIPSRINTHMPNICFRPMSLESGKYREVTNADQFLVKGFSNSTEEILVTSESGLEYAIWCRIASKDERSRVNFKRSLCDAAALSLLFERKGYCVEKEPVKFQREESSKPTGVDI